MAQLIEQLNEWISTLPEFADSGATLEYKYEREGVPRYFVESRKGRAVFKLYRDAPGVPRSLYNRRASERAGAEAVALREYAPTDLAPQLVWEGEMPPEIGGSGVIYGWVEAAPASAGNFSAEDAQRLAGALWEIHGHSRDLKLVAPRPRDLAGWWMRVHEQFRELDPGFVASLPTAVEAALTSLTQSVAGDANAHRRFWSGQLAPVHGRVELHNVLVAPGSVTLVDWPRYGLGDRAYEVASVVWNMAVAGQEQHVEAFVGAYMQRAEDVMLERRVQIYRRLLPYERWLDLLARRSRGEAPTGDDLEHGTYYLSSALAVYGAHEQEIGDTALEFSRWLARQPAGKPTEA